MADAPPDDPNCFLNPLECAGDAVIDSAVQNLADALKEGAKELIETTIGWWLRVDSIDIASSPAQEIRGWTLYIAIALAAGGAMWALIRTAYRRRSEPLWEAGGGLLRVAIVAGMTGAGGFLLLQQLMNAVDAFAEFVLNEAVSDRIVEMTAMTGVTSPGMVMFLAIVLIIVGAVQAVLMFLREGAILVLSGLLVLAAAGSMTHVTRGWWPKLTGVLLALIFYKAAAALVWGTALAFLDTTGSENPVRSFFVGVTMFVLSIFALGPMTKFFSWTAVSAGGGGGGAMLAAAGMGAYAFSQRGVSAPPSASQQANSLRNDLGPPTGSAPSGATRIVGASGPGASAAGQGASAAVGAAGAAAAPATAGLSAVGAMVAQGAASAGMSAKNKAARTMTGGDAE